MQKNEPARLHAMDSLRGLAALQVLFHHCFLMAGIIAAAFSNGYKPDGSNVWVDLMTFSPLHFLWTGQEAVVFFFVMSGFVLSIPYYKNKNGNYFSFLIKRIFRIYLPYIVALLLGMVCNAYFNDHSRIGSLSNWFNGFYATPLSTAERLNFIFQMRGYFHNVVTSLWSLPIELKVSAVFPLVALLYKRLNFFSCLALPVINIVFYHTGKRLGFQEAWPDFSLFYYFSFFLLGAFLSKYHATLLRAMSRFSGKRLWILWIPAVLLYTYKWIIQLLPPALYKIASAFPPDYAICIAAVLVLLLGTAARFERILAHNYLLALGKTSFSLYLIHPLVIGITGFVLGNSLPVYALIILSVVFSIALAFPFYYWVEWPLQKLGRRLSENLFVAPSRTLVKYP